MYKRQVLGKPVLSDEKNNKTTYVTLEGLEKAKKDVARISDDAVRILHELSLIHIWGDASVSITGGTIQGNVYGGGSEGLVQGKTNIKIEDGKMCIRDRLSPVHSKLQLL